MNTQSDHSKPKEVSVSFLQSFKQLGTLDSVYEIIDNVQSVCDSINLYFGKQVCPYQFKAIILSKIIQKVVFSLLAGFVCSTVQMYHILDRLRFGSNYELSDWHVAAHISLIVIHALEFTLILINGHTIKQKWRDLVRIIHRSKNNYPDEKFNIKMSELLVMIDLCEIQINASGLFPIDLTIVTSVSNNQ